MDITLDRLKHSLSVANKMRELAKDEAEVDSDDAFILGLLHDIGYQFTENTGEHAKVGGEVLRNQGYKYWKEVYYHGIPQEDFDSTMLQLLNYADMTIGPTGNELTIEERILDISNRYGKGSIQEETAIALAKQLKLQK